MLNAKIRPKALLMLGPLAQLALVVSIVLERLGNPAGDFVTGFLIGFAIAGNLAFLYAVTRFGNQSNL
jgi:hypothetical protein